MRSWHVVQEICKMKNEIVRVEDEIVTVKLQQKGKEDQIVWQMMAYPISPNHSNYEEWVNAICKVSYLVDHIFPLETHRIIYWCNFCKNETHLHYMCPFPQTEGWKGPTPDDVLKTPEYNNTRCPYNNPQESARGPRGHLLRLRLIQSLQT